MQQLHKEKVVEVEREVLVEIKGQSKGELKRAKELLVKMVQAWEGTALMCLEEQVSIWEVLSP